MRNRHVPQRSCVICGMKAAKRELFRIVRTPEHECVVDETGKQSGRGAYVCGRAACWDSALRGGRLKTALRGEISQADRERLAAFAERVTAPEGAVRTSG